MRPGWDGRAGLSWCEACTRRDRVRTWRRSVRTWRCITGTWRGLCGQCIAIIAIGRRSRHLAAVRPARCTRQLCAKALGVVLARGSQARDAERQRPERVFVPGAKDAIALRAGSSERYLLERLRDEAHRFAITHHRKRRGKRSLESALDGVPGVGPAMKKKLLAHFRSMSALRAADLEALQAVPGVGPKLAQRLHETLGGAGHA